MTPQEHTRAQRQLLYTAFFAALLIILILLNTIACSVSREKTFSKPKYDVGTTSHWKDGKPVVRSRYHKRFWFWQRDRDDRQYDPAP